jgi:hypothetical protein
MRGADADRVESVNRLLADEGRTKLNPRSLYLTPTVHAQLWP